MVVVFSEMRKIGGGAGGADDVFPFGHLNLRCPVEHLRLVNS